MKIVVRMVLYACLFGRFSPVNAWGAPPTNEDSGAKRAVLVGCTTYDHNPTKSLKGGTNDVSLVADTLKRHYQFSEADLVRLVEGHGEKTRPTRKNIVAAIRQLIVDSRPRDQALIYLAGHGSRQPDLTPSDDDPEPDGMDELFLPADIGIWNSETKTIENAIVDDEIRGWINELLEIDVSVVLIVDACHAGSSARGDLGSDTPRQISPSELHVPEAATTGLPHRSESALDRLAEGRWVAFYAAQANELAYERDVPEQTEIDVGKRPNPVRRGVFTHQLCAALERANRNLTYAEVIQQVHGNLIAEGWRLSTPGIEGTIKDRLIFDDARRRERSYLLERRAEKWTVDGGSLHGLTVGSRLAVYDPKDVDRKQSRGSIEIVHAGIATSQCKPVPKATGKPTRTEDLHSGDICVPIFLNLDQICLTVGIDPQLPADDFQTIQHRLETLTRNAASALRTVDCAEAQWIISSLDTEHWQLRPRAEALILRRGNPQTDAGPGIKLSRVEDEFATQLTRAARTQNLLQLARQMSWTDSGHLAKEIKLEVLRFPGDIPSAAPQILDLNHSDPLQEGDRLSFRIRNSGKEAADVTLLFIDSQLQIHALFPRTFAADNRIPGNSELSTPPSRVTVETTGREQALLIAVRATNRSRIPATFAFLAEADGHRARRSLGQSRGEDPRPRSFDSLLMNIGFSGNGTRGLGLESEEGVLLSYDWIVAAPSDH